MILGIGDIARTASGYGSVGGSVDVPMRTCACMRLSFSVSILKVSLCSRSCSNLCFRRDRCFTARGRSVEEYLYRGQLRSNRFVGASFGLRWWSEGGKKGSRRLGGNEVFCPRKMVKEQEKRLLWDLRTNEALMSSRDGSLGMRRSRPEERPWLAAHLIRSSHFKHFIDVRIHHVTFFLSSTKNRATSQTSTLIIGQGIACRRRWK
jgi:hypothetical protein